MDFGCNRYTYIIFAGIWIESVKSTFLYLFFFVALPFTEIVLSTLVKLKAKMTRKLWFLTLRWHGVKATCLEYADSMLRYSDFCADGLGLMGKKITSLSSSSACWT